MGRVVIWVLGCLAAIPLGKVIGQESEPASRSEAAAASRPDGSRRFEKLAGPPDLRAVTIIANAAAGKDTIKVTADGRVFFNIGKVHVTDDIGAGEGPRRWREDWVGRMSGPALARIQRPIVVTRGGSIALNFDDLADLARVPRWLRDEDDRRSNWMQHHQEPDGSWSPADFDWNCRGGLPCTGLGKESFRVASSALLVLDLLNAGYGPNEGERAPEIAVRRAMVFLLGNQQADGGFAGGVDHTAVMTDACAAIALCRAAALGKPPAFVRSARLVMGKLQRRQAEDGSFGTDSEPEKRPEKRLSAAVWSLLALKSAAAAGIEADPAVVRRGLAWIEQTVAAIEAAPNPDIGTLARARASRAVARLASGAPVADLSKDVDWLAEKLNGDDARVVDAETLLFTALVQFKDGSATGNTIWTKKRVIETQATSLDGCAAGTWMVPSVWNDLGGRLVSTALMTWVLEVYYRYPKANWVGE